MPARIEVQGGSRRGEVLWIEERVTRLGSDPGCQMRFQDAEVPPHAVTLEFRGGQYLVHNRADRPLVLEKQKLGPKEVRPWKGNTVLQLSPQVALVLRLMPDPSPSPPVDVNPWQDLQGAQAVEAAEAEEVEQADEEQEEEVEEEGKPAPGSKKVMPYVVIFVCVALSVLMLMKGGSGAEAAPQESPSETNKEFMTLVKELQKDRSNTALGPTPLLPLLQDARAADLRQQRNRANRLYGEVLLLLEGRRDPATGKYASEVEERTMKFISARLRQ